MLRRVLSEVEAQAKRVEPFVVSKQTSSLSFCVCASNHCPEIFVAQKFRPERYPNFIPG
jgi:hypothetical protein